MADSQTYSDYTGTRDNKLTDEMVLSAIEALSYPITTTKITDYINDHFLSEDCHRNTVIYRLNKLDDAGYVDYKTEGARTKLWSRSEPDDAE